MKFLAWEASSDEDESRRGNPSIMPWLWTATLRPWIVWLSAMQWVYCAGPLKTAQNLSLTDSCGRGSQPGDTHGYGGLVRFSARIGGHSVYPNDFACPNTPTIPVRISGPSSPGTRDGTTRFTSVNWKPRNSATKGYTWQSLPCASSLRAASTSGTRPVAGTPR